MLTWKFLGGVEIPWGGHRLLEDQELRIKETTMALTEGGPVPQYLNRKPVGTSVASGKGWDGKLVFVLSLCKTGSCLLTQGKELESRRA